jgi:hypothetical protein
MNGILGKTFRRNILRPLVPCVTLAALVFGASSSQAYLQTYDGFEYPSDALGSIDGLNGGTGWSTNWGAGLGGATSEIISNGSLSDPTATLYTYSNHVYSAGGFAGRLFNAPADWAFPGATNYFSILIRPENTPATNHYYGLQIFSNGGNTGNGHDLFVGKNGSGLNWGLEYSTNTIVGSTTNTVFVDSYSSTPAVANQAVFLVVRIIFASGVPDSFALYVNPTPGGSEPATPDATTTDDIGSQTGVALNSGNGGLASFDEIRIGATFASVSSSSSIPDPNLEVWEPFAYNSFTTPVSLDGQNGGAGWDFVSWGQYFYGGEVNYTNMSGSLSDPSGLLLTSGGRETTGGGYAGRYNFATNYTAGTSYGTPGTTNYYSFLMRPEALVTPSNYWGVGLLANNGGNGVFIGKPGDSLYYGLEVSTNNNVSFIDAFSITQAVSNQTVFLVARVNFLPVVGGVTNDVFRLYVNPTPGAPEPATPSAILTNYIGMQNGITLNSGDNGSGGTQVSYDEVRAGTTYADVTPRASHIQSIATSSTTNIALVWTAAVGSTNQVQAATSASGSYDTNNFVNIGLPIIIPGSTGPIVTNPPAIGSVITTNYLDFGGATNKARYYRVQQQGP